MSKRRSPPLRLIEVWISDHQKALADAISACHDVTTLLEVAETCIRTSGLLARINPRCDEALRYTARAEQAMRRVTEVRRAERAQS